MRKEYDFSDAKRARDIPHLVRLRASADAKPVVIAHIESDVVTAFEQRTHASKDELDAWVNQVLREWLVAHSA